jgi:hypothetical protein
VKQIVAPQPDQLVLLVIARCEKLGRFAVYVPCPVGGRTMMSQQLPPSPHEQPRQDPVQGSPPPTPLGWKPPKEKWNPQRQSMIALISAAASVFILPYFLAFLGVALGGRVLLFRRREATTGALVMSVLAVLIGIGSLILKDLVDY